MPKGRHTTEDLAFLREKGFVETADEIERLHKVEDAAIRLRDRLSTRLNDHLCEMKPGWDDSVCGFNEAWDVMRQVFDSGEPAGDVEKIKYWWSKDRQWFCLRVSGGGTGTTVSLTVAEAEALMEEVMQTPRFLEFQKECEDRALELLDDARAKAASGAVKDQIMAKFDHAIDAIKSA
jgi:hypothetical protein